MDEAALAAAFEEATYHIEHHSHDLNYIGKYVLSSLPRENGYKVVLTGEGADEQFGGYPLFLPDFLRGQLQTSSGTKGTAGRNDVGAWEAQIKQSYDVIGADTTVFGKDQPLPILTPAAMSSFTPPESLFVPLSTLSPLDCIARNVPPHIQQAIRHQWHPLHSAQYVWQKGHLANQFLSGLGDRVEMAHSVEARTPFLDHVTTEYVNSLPPGMKIRERMQDGTTTYVEKYALREAVKPFVTEEVYARTKHAYTAPTTYPVGGPIHQLLSRLVTSDKVGRLGFVRWDSVRTLWDTAFSASGAVNDGTTIWAWRVLVMVAQWVVLGERFGVAAAAPA
jgi:asparagine synthase (glutamine-hydrolysing)